jgi:hypothetical protein
MKAAFHFNADFHRNEESGYYSFPIYRSVFNSITTSLSSLNCTISAGDLSLRPLTNKRYEAALDLIIHPPIAIWHSFHQSSKCHLLAHNIFVMLFDDMDKRQPVMLDRQLRQFPWYLGALEVANVPLHRIVYEDSLIKQFRLVGRNIHLFWDGICAHSQNSWLFEMLEKMGFDEVKYEALIHRSAKLTEETIDDLFAPMPDLSFSKEKLD